MPGTIQVTVLEFKGISSSSKPSAKSLKVSMGKRHYQTWDKGEFSFPITKLGEDLMVALLDAGGNEIAHEDIRTMQIIEKGFWDDVFSINGGGHVHMKLQFVLSEEERNRIRIMRESAVKKKIETNPNIKLRFSETISSTYDSLEKSTKNEQKVSDFQKGLDVVRPKVFDSQAGSSLTSTTSSAASPPSYRKEGVSTLESVIIPVKESSLNATDGSCQGANGAKIETPQVTAKKPGDRNETRPIDHIRSDIMEKASSKSAILDRNSSVASKSGDEPSQISNNQDRQEKIRSNVKKMISAFENSQLQKVKSVKKAPSVPSQLNRFRNEALFEDRRSEATVCSEDKNLKKAPSVPSQLNQFKNEKLLEDREPKVLTKFKNHLAENLQQISSSLGETEPSEAPKESASTVIPIPPQVKDSNVDDALRAASRKQTVKELEKSQDDLMRRSISETATIFGSVNSCESSVVEGSGSGRGTGLKRSTAVNSPVSSNPKPKPLEDYYGEKCYSGMWIFADNTRRLCITTAGEQIMKTMGRQRNEDNVRRVYEICSEPQDKNLMNVSECNKMGKNQKKTADQTDESGCDSSPDDSTNGLVGQVIKIAVILGFGVLVFLTRQKEPRKKHRDENPNLAMYQITPMK